MHVIGIDIDPVWATGLTAFSVLTLVLGILFTPWIVSRLPVNFFLAEHAPTNIAWFVTRNILGTILILLGIAMLVLPGQGLLTILLGAALADLPYKRQMLARVAAQPRVLTTLNKWRRKFGRKEFIDPSPKG